MGWYQNPTPPAWDRLKDIEPSNWRKIENTPDTYITQTLALNLPTGPLGDWHDAFWRPLVSAKSQSTRSEVNDGLCRLGTELWGRDEIIDARPALRLIGHPQGDEPAPVWAASHPRAVAEIAMASLRENGQIRNPDRFEARRWLDRKGRETCTRLLNEARSSLKNPDEHRALDEWIDGLHRSTLLHPITE